MIHGYDTHGRRDPQTEGEGPEHGIHQPGHDPGLAEESRRWVRWPDFRSPASHAEAVDRREARRRHDVHRTLPCSPSGVPHAQAVDGRRERDREGGGVAGERRREGRRSYLAATWVRRFWAVLAQWGWMTASR
jgi:hypothetical protein